jgi:GT2 family glycosyltransferase
MYQLCGQGGDVDQAPLVLIVIVNWNGAAETLASVASLAHMDYQNWRVLLIDNGSTDGSFEALKPLASEQIEVVGLSTNTGYTGGCNLGLRHALEIGADYAWLLNSDATTETNTLSSLVTLAESDERIGLVSPLIASPGNPPEIVIAGAIWDKKSAQYGDTHDIEVARRWLREYPRSGVVHGTAMLVPARVIRRIGLLDEALFAYYEDVDYSIRSSEAGFRNVVDWSSQILHDNKNMYTRPETIKPHYWYYMARNELRTLRKHLEPIKGLRCSWWSVKKFLRLRASCSGNPAASTAIVAGLWHGLIRREGPYDASLRVPRTILWFADVYERRLASSAKPSGGHNL